MTLGRGFVIDNDFQRRLETLRAREHARCFVCDSENQEGFRVIFKAHADGSVTAYFPCAEVFRGYPRWLHGGVISSLLDGAMTNCLFARGIVAVTAELSVRFLQPVLIDRQVQVKAWLVNSYAPLYLMQAELLQDGRIRATASSKFMTVDQEVVESHSGSGC